MNYIILYLPDQRATPVPECLQLVSPGFKTTYPRGHGPKKQSDLLLNLTINLDGCTVVSNKTVKDLGVTLDPDLSFNEHINTVSRTALIPSS